MPSPRRGVLAAAAAVSAITLIAFVPSLGSGFVSMDDPGYVTGNANLSRPFPELLAWAFGDTRQVNLWVPLTWLSLAADRAVFGAGPFGHHLVNALLHAANAGLVVILCAGLLSLASPVPGDRTVRALSAAFAALFFSLHPLRVESVSWVTERKDVLCGLFALLATLAWLRHATGRGRRWLLAATGLHAMALLAKPVAVVVPLTWLILDAWPLGRRPRIAEKVPVLLLSLGAGIVAVVAQRPALLDLSAAPLASRLLVALAAPCRYLALTVLPIGLHPYRPYPSTAELLSAGRLAAVAGTVALSALLTARARRWPGALAAWMAFLALLLPNLGILQAGNQELADRFTYLPAVVVSGALAGVVEGVLSPGARLRAVIGVGASVLCALAVAGVAQQGHWRDSVRLWTRNVSLEPRSGISWSDLAYAQLEAGDLERAITAKMRSVEIAEEKAFPGLPGLDAELAGILSHAARQPGAGALLERAMLLARRPRFPRMAAESLRGAGRFAEAERLEAMATGLESPGPAGAPPSVRREP